MIRHVYSLVGAASLNSLNALNPLNPLIAERNGFSTERSVETKSDALHRSWIPHATRCGDAKHIGGKVTRSLLSNAAQIVRIGSGSAGKTCIKRVTHICMCILHLGLHIFNFC